MELDFTEDPQLVEIQHMVRLVIMNFAGILEPEQERELEAWITAEPHRREMVANLRKQGIPPEWKEIDAIDLDASWKDIQAKVAAIPGATPLPDRSYFREL